MRMLDPISTEKSLALWAEDINDRLPKSRDEDVIRYSKEEMEVFLSIDIRTGLYVLPVPLTSEAASFFGKNCWE